MWAEYSNDPKVIAWWMGENYINQLHDKLFDLRYEIDNIQVSMADLHTYRKELEKRKQDTTKVNDIIKRYRDILNISKGQRGNARDQSGIFFESATELRAYSSESQPLAYSFSTPHKIWHQDLWHFMSQNKKENHVSIRKYLEDNNILSKKTHKINPNKFENKQMAQKLATWINDMHANITSTSYNIPEITVKEVDKSKNKAVKKAAKKEAKKTVSKPAAASQANTYKADASTQSASTTKVKPDTAPKIKSSVKKYNKPPETITPDELKKIETVTKKVLAKNWVKYKETINVIAKVLKVPNPNGKITEDFAKALMVEQEKYQIDIDGVYGKITAAFINQKVAKDVTLFKEYIEISKDSEVLGPIFTKIVSWIELNQSDFDNLLSINKKSEMMWINYLIVSTIIVRLNAKDWKTAKEEEFMKRYDSQDNKKTKAYDTSPEWKAEADAAEEIAKKAWMSQNIIDTWRDPNISKLDAFKASLNTPLAASVIWVAVISYLFWVWGKPESWWKRIWIVLWWAAIMTWASASWFWIEDMLDAVFKDNSFDESNNTPETPTLTAAQLAAQNTTATTVWWVAATTVAWQAAVTPITNRKPGEAVSHTEVTPSTPKESPLNTWRESLPKIAKKDDFSVYTSVIEASNIADSWSPFSALPNRKSALEWLYRSFQSNNLLRGKTISEIKTYATTDRSSTLDNDLDIKNETLIINSGWKNISLTKKQVKFLLLAIIESKSPWLKDSGTLDDVLTWEWFGKWSEEKFDYLNWKFTLKEWAFLWWAAWLAIAIAKKTPAWRIMSTIYAWALSWVAYYGYTETDLIQRLTSFFTTDEGKALLEKKNEFIKKLSQDWKKLLDEIKDAWKALDKAAERNLPQSDINLLEDIALNDVEALYRTLASKEEIEKNREKFTQDYARHKNLVKEVNKIAADRIKEIVGMVNTSWNTSPSGNHSPKTNSQDSIQPVVNDVVSMSAGLNTKLTELEVTQQKIDSLLALKSTQNSSQWKKTQEQINALSASVVALKKTIAGMTETSTSIAKLWTQITLLENDNRFPKNTLLKTLLNLDQTSLLYKTALRFENAWISWVDGYITRLNVLLWATTWTLDISNHRQATTIGRNLQISNLFSEHISSRFVWATSPYPALVEATKVAYTESIKAALHKWTDIKMLKHRMTHVGFSDSEISAFLKKAKSGGTGKEWEKKIWNATTADSDNKSLEANTSTVNWKTEMTAVIEAQDKWKKQVWKAQRANSRQKQSENQISDTLKQSFEEAKTDFLSSVNESQWFTNSEKDLQHTLDCLKDWKGLQTIINDINDLIPILKESLDIIKILEQIEEKKSPLYEQATTMRDKIIWIITVVNDWHSPDVLDIKDTEWVNHSLAQIHSLQSSQLEKYWPEIQELGGILYRRVQKAYERSIPEIISNNNISGTQYQKINDNLDSLGLKKINLEAMTHVTIFSADLPTWNGSIAWSAADVWAAEVGVTNTPSVLPAWGWTIINWGPAAVISNIWLGNTLSINTAPDNTPLSEISELSTLWNDIKTLMKQNSVPDPKIQEAQIIFNKEVTGTTVTQIKQLTQAEVDQFSDEAKKYIYTEIKQRLGLTK